MRQEKNNRTISSITIPEHWRSLQRLWNDQIRRKIRGTILLQAHLASQLHDGILLALRVMQSGLVENKVQSMNQGEQTVRHAALASVQGCLEEW